MKIDRRNESDVIILQPNGRLDAGALSEFTACLNREINEGARKILLDFSQTDYMSSAGIRALIEGQKQLAAKNGTMAFCSINDQLQELFEVVQLGKIFKIYRSEFDALDAMM